MDGLLFDSERIVQRSWEIAGDELGIPHMENTFQIYSRIAMNISENISGKTFHLKNLEN